VDRLTDVEQGPTVDRGVEPWVAETRFGTWFINTGVWVKYVLKRAIDDVAKLAGGRLPQSPAVLDLACGRGRAIPLLEQALGARSIVGVDVDASDLELARKNVKARCPVRLVHCGASKLELEDASIDVAFCHQSFHHFIDQEATLAELRRVIRPGGVLLMSESCRSFIYTRRIRYLFRHPMEVQKTAEEYIDLFRNSGFTIAPDNYKTSFVWWSRRDMGIFERLGIPPKPPPEDTLLNVAAFR
jgi:SAM-dependent methyltransferase